MDIFWYTSENTMAIIQQKKGSACCLTNIINSWSCYRRRKKEHSTWDRCAYVNPRQTQHQCLDPVDEETTKIRIDLCLAKCTGELIRMVYVSNNKPMPNIEVSSVLEIHRQLIIDSFPIGNIGSVSAEDMILNFMLNMDLFSYK